MHSDLQNTEARLEHKSGDLSLIPGTHLVERELMPGVSSDLHSCPVAFTDTHIDLETQIH